MAELFVSSVDGSNADTGATWTLAKQTVPGALAIAVDGDIIKVDSAHNFNAAAGITWTPPAGRVAIISVNRAGGDAWLAGAAESVGAANAAFLISNAANSSMFVFGITINGGTNNSSLCNINILTTTSVSSFLHLKSCTTDLKTASASAFVAFGATIAGASRSLNIRAEDHTFICSGSRAGTFINLAEAVVEIINPTISTTGGTKPAICLSGQSAADICDVTIRDGDITGYSNASGAYISVANISGGKFRLENLKLSASPSLTSGAWPGGSGSILLRNCDSGDTISTLQYLNAYGTLIENESVYISGGAAFNGVGVSWQIVTTAACNESFPFVTPPILADSTLTTAQTATVETVRDNATALTDREAWLEISYPNSASFPSYTNANDRNVNPFTASGVSQTSSSATWTGTGGFSNVNKRSLDVPFTAAEVGLLRGTVSIAVASTTLYVEPLLRLS